MPLIEHLKTIALDLPPSCVEFCPNDPRYAIVGTYNLEKEEEGGPPTEEDGKQKSQQRNGSLILIKVKDDEVELVQTLPTPSAILDVHFHPFQRSLFGVATSTGSMGIYELQDVSSESPNMIHMRTIDYFDPKILVTAFSWHPNGTAIGMTHTSGDLCLAPYTEESSKEDPHHVQVWQHSLEAWTLAFLPDGSGVLSGADDSTLQFTELPRSPVEAIDGSVAEPEYISTRRARWVDERTHGAGVTAILPVHCDDAGIFIVTGSYDDRIRLIYATSTGRRKSLAELNLEGGVWRVKILDTKHASGITTSLPGECLLLVSCMHAGARIVKLSRKEDEWQFEVLAKFEEHKSMNYGSDSQTGINERGQRTIVSTSFYDRLLCLWRY